MAPQPPSSARPVRHDCYQTNDTVVVTIYAKNQVADQTHVSLEGDKLVVRTPELDCVVPVPVPVRGVQDVRIVPTKMEIVLEKSANAPEVPAAQHAPRSSSKWDSWDVDDDAPPAGSGDAELQSFFQKLYADADDDTRRAMVKSFQESGGTALSTNWAEVGRQTMPVRAPQGMEVRRYEQ
ncbi:hypothetical protein MNAN1_002062 [Malassezia nana]|uniref:SGS domain-containing protein n=1 Tax=Malassezia nana TaxID=180528 RepID=A0AAF0J2G0_9BASI|nr:hypothetical protein MNAN1_002062 [Malassezia nana]